MSDGRSDPREGVAAFAVGDLEASLDYYQNQLGFEVAFRWGDPAYFAGVCRGAVTIHLTSAEDRRAAIGLSTLSLFVGDADAAHRDLVERGAHVTVEIDDRPYGLRDFMVEDPDGNRLAFGSVLEGAG
jgi:catechol 2,3-dioxygenase-like lactoylglutathione lyase family enzyme